jgi:kynurenine formamidase
MTSRYVDLSHPMESGAFSAAQLAGSQLVSHGARIQTAADAATCLDAPYRAQPGGADVAQLPLERLVNVPVVVIRACGRRSIGPELIDDPGLLWGKAVLVHTGWSRYWGTPTYTSAGPFLTTPFATAVVEANVALLGIDGPSVDHVDDPAQPVHGTVLGHGIPLIENLTNLTYVPDHGARLTALPVPVCGAGSVPVRAVVVVG